MKKLSILFTLLLTLGLAAQAQTPNNRIGIKGGINASELAIKKNQIDGQDNRWGFQAGVVAEINLSTRFAFQPELLYTTRGSDYRLPSGVNVKEDLGYIDLPLLLKYKPLKFINIYAGPQISFLTNGKYTYEAAGIEYERKNKDAFHSLDVGFALGLGVDFGQLFFDARYMNGLVNTLKDNDRDDFTGRDKGNNAGIQVSVGYFF